MKNELTRCSLEPESLICGFKIQRKIGSGSYSDVFSAIQISTQQHVVLKIFRKGLSSCGEAETNIMKILNELNSHQTYFLNFYGSFLYRRSFYTIVTEEYGISLLDAINIRKNFQLPIPAIRSILKKIASTIAIIHQHGMIHTDIKLENILLPKKFNPISDFDFNPLSNHSFQIDCRLIDFGSVVSASEEHHELASSAMYRAPEIFLGLVWDSKIDSWSLGTLLIELLVGFIPYHISDTQEKIFLIQHIIGPFPDWMIEECTEKSIKEMFSCGLISSNFFDPECREKLSQEKALHDYICKQSPSLIDLIKKLVEIDPRKRASVESILNHPFFTEN